VRDWVAVSGIALWTSVVLMVVLLLAGSVMMAIRWGPSAWTITALIALVVIALVSQIVSRRRISELSRGLSQRSPPAVSAGFRTRTADRRLSVSVWLRIGIVVGILELMTTKPDVTGAVLTIVIAALLGAGVGMFLAYRSSAEAEQGSLAA